MHQYLFIAILVVLTGCHAFSDSEDVGPQPGPVAPNNTNVTTNNSAPNNIAPNNGSECIPAADCDLCANGDVFPCQEIFSGCLVYSDPVPCNGECIDQKCVEPPNNGQACLDVVCNECTSTGEALLCDDDTCPQTQFAGPCPEGKGCINGTCEDCLSFCEPSQDNVCDPDLDVVSCVVDRWGCTAPLTYQCDYDPCAETAGGFRCDMAGAPCMEEDIVACMDAFTPVVCIADGSGGFEWVVTGQCQPGTRCEPEAGDCREFEHNLDEL